MPVDLFKYHRRILSILEDDEKARDNDVILYAKLIQGPPFMYDLDRFTARQLLTAIYTGKLPHLESVRRTRQKLQEEKPRIEGKKRAERKEREQQWKKKVIEGIDREAS